MRHAVILAGGGGTRLWPASRRNRPKQLLALGTRPGESLLAATWRRIEALIPATRIAAVTASAHVDPVRAEMPAESSIWAEPVGRNTAAALGLAAVHVVARDPDGVIAALPADHVVGDEQQFRDVVDQALTAAETSHAIVTIGIVPTRPEIGYGYLELGEPSAAVEGAIEVARFFEKPRLADAQAYVAGGNHLWNAGMFFTRADVLLAAIERHMPRTFAGLMEIASALRDGDPSDVSARVYAGLPSVSIDHGVMEKMAGSVLAIRGDFAWSDLGSWSAVADVRPADSNGNVVSGVAVLHEARGNIVVGDDDTAIAVIGVDDLVIVKSGNAILVVPRSRAQDVREAVELLQRHQLERFL